MIKTVTLSRNAICWLSFWISIFIPGIKSIFLSLQQILYLYLATQYPPMYLTLPLPPAVVPLVALGKIQSEADSDFRLDEAFFSMFCCMTNMTPVTTACERGTLFKSFDS